MLRFGRRVDGLSGRRHRMREPVRLAASAMTIDRSQSVFVADLSASGAQLHGRGFPDEGSEVLLAVGSLDSFARVAWRDNSACGLEFEEPLPDEELVQLKREGRWAFVTGAG